MCAKSPLGEWHVSHLPAPLEVFLFPDSRSESLRRLDSLFIVKHSWRTDQIRPASSSGILAVAETALRDEQLLSAIGGCGIRLLPQCGDRNER